jgi:hypothetical protein
MTSTQVTQPLSPAEPVETRLDLGTVANIADIAVAIGVGAKYSVERSGAVRKIRPLQPLTLDLKGRRGSLPAPPILIADFQALDGAENETDPLPTPGDDSRDLARPRYACAVRRSASRAFN